jgi:DNA mismatch endonuclease (patch repair protein)
MADNLSQKRRSALMARVHSRDTGPELLLRSALHRAGYRYALHKVDLPGTPDVVFTKRKKIIFIHGCFWHGHRKCNQGRPAKSNTAFWTKKLASNRARDKAVLTYLAEEGWKVHIVWSCQLRSAQKIADTITEVTRFLES